MTQDMFNFSPDAPFDPEVLSQAKADIRDLGKTMISGKMEEFKLLQESAANGGPSSVHEAFYILMRELNIGIRALAAAVNVKRKFLLRMLEGDVVMSPEVHSAIVNHFKSVAKKQGKSYLFS